MCLPVFFQTTQSYETSLLVFIVQNEHAYTGAYCWTEQMDFRA